MAVITRRAVTDIQQNLFTRGGTS